MSSRVDLEVLQQIIDDIARGAPVEYLGELVSDAQVELSGVQAEIKRLRLELASAKQHIRACHAVAHGTAGIAEDAIEASLRLAKEARRVTEKETK